jgi:hypothetical protein
MIFYFYECYGVFLHLFIPNATVDMICFGGGLCAWIVTRFVLWVVCVHG